VRLDGSIAECRLIAALDLFVNVQEGDSAVVVGSCSRLKHAPNMTRQ
jgi:hypothetical protein